MNLSRRKVAAYAAQQLNTGKPVKPLARQLAAYLVDSGKAEDVDLLLHDIAGALSANHGVATASITAAHPLTTALRQAIVGFVRQAEGAKDVVVLNEATDPELIGGVKVHTAHGLFDATVRTQLNQLKTRGDK